MQQGLKQNWQQFFLLVIINAFVGGMVGMERSILPSMATEIFSIEANFAILSFIIVFGISKAISNYLMGKLANKNGPKKLLILGWLFGIPVPFILMFAPDWNWIIFANALLGINQGFAWSATVIMKIDLVGEKNRGLAMGINEFAGYLSVGLMAFVTAWIADSYGKGATPEHYDKEFLRQWFARQGWHFVIRQQGKNKVRWLNQAWIKLNELALAPGQTRYIGWVRLTETHDAGWFWLILHWEIDEDEPWFLVSDRSGQRSLIRIYKSRMWCPLPDSNRDGLSGRGILSLLRICITR